MGNEVFVIEAITKHSILKQNKLILIQILMNYSLYIILVLFIGVRCSDLCVDQTLRTLKKITLVVVWLLSTELLVS